MLTFQQSSGYLPGIAQRKDVFVMDEARLTEAGVERIAHLTTDFSFAYLKVLILSALMQWVSDPTGRRMDDVMAERASVLREQMKSVAEQETKKNDENTEDSDD